MIISITGRIACRYTLDATIEISDVNLLYEFRKSGVLLLNFPISPHELEKMRHLPMKQEGIKSTSGFSPRLMQKQNIRLLFPLPLTT